MTAREFVDKIADENDLPLLTCDGMDDAIVGVAEFWHSHGQTLAVAYDYSKCIDALMANGMSEEDAEEYFNYNVHGAYLGPHTPVFITYPYPPPPPVEPVLT